MNNKNLVLIICALVAFLIHNSVFASSPWSQLEHPRIVLKGDQMIKPSKYLSYSLNRAQLRSEFQSAPEYSEATYRSANAIISLPMPDGSFHDFKVFKSHVMHPDLAARYPQIETYSGQGITDPTATAVFDFTQFGFHAMILSASGTSYIDPYSLQDTDFYIVYAKRDFVSNKSFNCLMQPGEELTEIERTLPPGTMKSVGTTLKTYRLALAATGEYTAFYGGTVPGALAGMVTSINRVTGIYERDLAIRLVLIANTDLLIYTNATTDPYTNNDGGVMLGQNQTNVTSIIGGNNYDIGHVFSTGGGGIAGLGVICNFSQKARGVTGSPAPVNDAFDVDYVAHEMGHQFGGNHTFNCEVGSCSGNRAFTAAYEPGSGSTIMAYAGICGNNNLQSNSDDIFHTKSFDEIIIYTTTGIGSNCPVTTSTFNNPPVINPIPNYIIPYLTPFRLTGDAFDPDGDPITYCWEQYNLGPAGVWNNPSGGAPIFRSFDPVVSPTRLFPKLANILSNTQTIGEVKPSYARTLSFKLTVRDNRLNGGGVTNNDTPYQVDVINTGQAFAVTSPNVTGIIWNAGGVETVTWNVGGSDLAPISTPLVNILLSTDGGQTFPTVLASQVPNNGTYNVNVPFVTTTNARVMVEGDGNIFFDINDKNFEIGTVGIGEVDEQSNVVLMPNPASNQFEILVNDKAFGLYSNLSVELIDVTGRKIMSENILKSRQIINVENYSRGIYFYNILSNSQVVSTGKVVLK